MQQHANGRISGDSVTVDLRAAYYKGVAARDFVGKNIGPLETCESPRRTRAGMPRSTSLGGHPFRRPGPSNPYSRALSLAASLHGSIDSENTVVIAYEEDPEVSREGTSSVIPTGYAVYPSSPQSRGLKYAMQSLLCKCGILLRSPVISEVALRVAETNSPVVRLADGSKLQAVPSLAFIAAGKARRLQWGALLRTEDALLVWADHIDDLVPRVQEFQKAMFDIVKNDIAQAPPPTDRSVTGSGLSSATSRTDSDYTEEEGQISRARLPYAMIVTTVALMVNIVLSCSVVGDITAAYLTDGSYFRFFYILFIPVQLFFCQFFFQVLIWCIFNPLGPVKQMKQNSLYYSAVKPKRDFTHLPHITVQIPVYMESLKGVIEPTIKSIERAITTYEMQGGTVNIFVNDDGMQNLSEEDAAEKIKFYARHGIGWTARPPHKKDGFIRRGRFKKASNMNYGLNLALQVERLLQEFPNLTSEQALQQVLARDGKAWGGGSISIGEIILIVDSDTRVPEDCFMDAAMEMRQSPEVAILQHEASTLIVVGNYWENGIAFFTDIIYHSIKTCCAAGEVAPFVGHNAFLRWSAIKEVAFKEDGTTKFWSESHVSEDFDMALRLQIKGYITRYAVYSDGGFQEGVSLSVNDEIKRWEKYSYGCAELVFHPFVDWLRKGPLTPLFVRYLTTSAIPFTSKISTIGYIGSYYTIGAAWITATVWYILYGLFADSIDTYFEPSIQILYAVMFVFNVFSTVGMSCHFHRINKMNFPKGLFLFLVWMPFMMIFFSGLSYHCSKALMARLCSWNIQWSSTEKELADSTFFLECQKTFKEHWRMYIVFSFVGAMIVAFAFFTPDGWEIRDWGVVVPMALLVAGHALSPILLNPMLTLFFF